MGLPTGPAILISLFYIFAISTALEAFACSEGEKSFLFASPQFSCSVNDNNYIFVLIGGACGLLVYGIAFPAYLARVAYKDPESFLARRYRPAMRLWEQTVIANKTYAVALSIFLITDGNLQAGLALAAPLLLGAAEMCLQPYAEARHNRLSVALYAVQAVQLATLLAGGGDDDASGVVLFGCVGASLVAVVGVMVAEGMKVKGAVDRVSEARDAVELVRSENRRVAERKGGSRRALPGKSGARPKSKSAPPLRKHTV